MLLAPVSALYQAASWARSHLATPYKAKVPVICIGNLVAGGAGKTPVALFLARYLKEQGHVPHIISRGYGSHVNVPVQVNPSLHSFRDVGDEPLLLSKVAPTWVCKNRKLSMEKAIEQGATILIMDDGFQNPLFYKDLSFLVIDGNQGLGNGKVIPAGPLRESIHKGFSRADSILLIGQDVHQNKSLVKKYQKPLIEAELVPIKAAARKVIAFAGLGYPQKFFQFLKKQNYDVIDEVAFPDHHPYSKDELDKLILKAKNKGVRLITTEKDLLRVPQSYRNQIDVLKVQVKVLNIKILNQLLGNIL